MNNEVKKTSIAGLIRVNPCASVEKRKSSKSVRIPTASTCIYTTCVATHNSQLATHNCGEAASFVCIRGKNQASGNWPPNSCKLVFISGNN